MNGTRFFRLLGLTGILFFLASGFTPLPQLLEIWLGAHPDLAQADAIVVLAHRVSERGGLSDASAASAYHAINLYQGGLAPFLVFSGGGLEGGPTEARVRTELARARGVPAAAILTESGLITRDEARHQWALLQPRGVRTILLVTDALQMLRAQPVFERTGFLVHAAPSDPPADPGTHQGRLKLTEKVLEQLLGLLYYRVAGFI